MHHLITNSMQIGVRVNANSHEKNKELQEPKRESYVIFHVVTSQIVRFRSRVRLLTMKKD